MSETLDICICTFRRPQVAETIASLGAQQLPAGIALHLIVADNEPEPAAQGIVEKAAAAVGLPVTYVHAPAANISIARNACLEAARSNWIAFIDDDEEAAPDWIARLLARRAGVNVVFGLSQAVYPADTPGWMVAGDFHSNRIGPRDGAHNGYTCNVLLDRRFFAMHGIAFDLALGRTGGEDTLFFAQAQRAGARFAYAPDAVVTEPIPAKRTTLAWLWKRRFRAGQTDYDLHRRGGTNLVARGAGSAAKIAYCAGRATLALHKPDRAVAHLLRGALHIGFIASLLGRRTYEEYR